MTARSGRIVKSLSGFYSVDVGGEIVVCRARGVMRNQGVTPLVGDRVTVSDGDGLAAVEEILPRKNALLRPPVANLERLYLLSAFTNPAPNFLLLDTQIAICERAGIEPVLVFNKCDEGDFASYVSAYRPTGYEIHVISCVTGEGIDDLRESIPRGICAFTGNSGVGKSSLLNALVPGLSLPTGEVSEKLGRGRHTTRHVELFDMGNGRLLADTPGFSSLEGDPVPKEEVADLFREFRAHLGACRFSTCSHTCEKGCGVLAALEKGEIAPSRHESYCELYRRAAASPTWDKKRPRS